MNVTGNRNNSGSKNKTQGKKRIPRHSFLFFITTLLNSFSYPSNDV